MLPSDKCKGKKINRCLEFSRDRDQQMKGIGNKKVFPRANSSESNYSDISSSGPLPKAENSTKMDALHMHTSLLAKFGSASCFRKLVNQVIQKGEPNGESERNVNQNNHYHDNDQIQQDHITPLSDEDKLSLRKTLTESNNIILKSMTEKQRNNFIEKSEKLQFDEGDFITTRGDSGEYFYTIKEGDITYHSENIEASESDNNCYDEHEVINRSSDLKSEMKDFDTSDISYLANFKRLSLLIPDEWSDKKIDGTIGPGCSFGEQALLYECTHMVTHVAKSQFVTVWRINKHDFRECLCKFYHPTDITEQAESLKTIRKVVMLKDTDEELLIDISRCMISTTFLEGERIINKGETGNLFYIIKSGNVRIHNIGIGDSQYSDMILGEGEWFGESAITKTHTIAHVTADSNVVELLILAKADCHRLRDQFQTAMEKFKLEKVLAAIPMFAQSNLSSDDIKRLFCISQSKHFGADQTIARMGETFEAAIYIVCSGKIRVSNESTNGVHDLIIGDYCGENSICEDINFINNLTIKTLEDTRCVIITKDMIERVIGSVSRLGKQMRLVSRKLESSIEVSDLKKECILGIGAFGKVWLVKHKETGSVYALKVMEKFKILKLRAVKNILREKNILGSINHIFILDLVTVLQDDQSLYLLTNFIQGGELFSLIHKGTKQGMLNDSARFYGACIFEALSHLHQRNICYRDLKPENLVIDSDGYSILIDFGFAKLVSNKTYTICGTPEYMSPELILGKGYGLGVDDWAFGILLYEMLLGRTPFVRKNNAYLAITKRIIKGKYKFPKKGNDTIFLSSSANSIISSLLCPDIETRAGFLCKKNDESPTRNHPWFEGIFENDLLLKKLVPAPWIPTINNSMDSSNFDNFKKEETKEKEIKIRMFSNEQQSLFEDF